MRIEDSLSRQVEAPSFGRKGAVAAIDATARSALFDDVKLFALTFVGGFLFVSLYLA